MHAVLDTNVVVSALLSPYGTCARVWAAVLAGRLQVCYDARILAEYRGVLGRTELSLDPVAVGQVLRFIERTGQPCVPPPLPPLAPDPDDTPFWEVAIHTDALVITGNRRHFPAAGRVVSPAEVLEQLSHG
ncbi:MAG: PIN domain-containing protein [Bifidobacteriaceae bacterium]|jgi:predicted nucleic acid-binding protein|nr:PIN domain-containing protein [Bifidobacteriaceae bacterium]